MILCRAVTLSALALLLQISISQANSCNKRSIVVQLRMPQRVNLTIQYPEQKNPVNFVPYPYKPGNFNPSQCFTCQGSTCTKCNTNSYTKPARPATATKTNIVIDLRKQKPNVKNDTNNTTKDGTVVVLEDDTRAYSAGGSLAIGKNGASAASSAATSASQSDIIATLNEQPTSSNQAPGNTEDIYVKDAAKASSGAAANAKEGSDNQSSPKSPNQGSQPEQPQSSDQGSTPGQALSPAKTPDTDSKPDQQAPTKDQGSDPNQQPPTPSTDQNSSPSDSSDSPKKEPSDSDDKSDKNDKDNRDDKSDIDDKDDKDDKDDNDDKSDINDKDDKSDKDDKDNKDDKPSAQAAAASASGATASSG